MTAFIQRTLPVPAFGASSPSVLIRAGRTIADTAAILVDSFRFAQEMQSAHTPAARRAVLDRHAV